MSKYAPIPAFGGTKKKLADTTLPRFSIVTGDGTWRLILVVGDQVMGHVAEWMAVRPDYTRDDTGEINKVTLSKVDEANRGLKLRRDKSRRPHLVLSLAGVDLEEVTDDGSETPTAIEVDEAWRPVSTTVMVDDLVTITVPQAIPCSNGKAYRIVPLGSAEEQR
jgi:hypothetical protein